MMKKIIILLICCVTGQVFGQGIEFFHGTFDEALEKAKQEEKLIFLDAFASWCGPCKRMASTVFTQGVVGDYFNKSFINFKIDMEQGEGPKLDQKFKVTAYPTLLIISPKGEIVQRHVGGMDPDGLDQFCQNGCRQSRFQC